MTNVTTENNDHHNHDPHYILPPYGLPSIDHGPAGGHIPAEFQRSRLNSEKFQSKFMRWTIRGSFAYGCYEHFGAPTNQRPLYHFDLRGYLVIWS